MLRYVCHASMLLSPAVLAACVHWTYVFVRNFNVLLL
jgi:hypothetical protein